MKEFTPRSFLAMTLVLTVGQTYAAAPTVGMVVARNTIRIDSSPIRGNATVFNGNVLESAGGSSELRLNNGGAVHMAPNARVRMFQNVAELQSGKIQMSGAQANANQIRVEAALGSSAVLDRTGNRVVVGSLQGSIRVTNKQGILLARLEPGNALAFEADPQNPSQQAPPQGNVPPGAGVGTGQKQPGASGAGSASGSAAGASAAGSSAAGVGRLSPVAIGAIAGAGVIGGTAIAVAATRSENPATVSVSR